jgi:hypothetical protein
MYRHLAQSAVGGGGLAPIDIPPIDENDVFDILARFANWMFIALLLTAVGFVLYAAYKYLTAGGDPAKIGEATSALIYAAVATAVALIAGAIPLLVQQLVSI